MPGRFKYYLSLVFCISLLFESYDLVAQKELTFDVLSVNEGLSSSVVNSILQDSRGYLWIATRDGLNKYDGVGMGIIRFSSKYNVITSVVESADHTLWVAVVGLGVVKYDPILEASEVYTSDPQNVNSLRDDEVSFLHEDQFGNLWIINGLKGIEKLNTDTGQFQAYLEGDAYGNVTYVNEDDEGFVWVGTDHGELHVYDGRKDQFHTFQIADNDKERVSSIHFVNPSEILVGSDIGLYLFDRTTSTFTQVAPGGLRQVTSIWADLEGTVWLSAEDDLVQLDIDNRSVVFRYCLQDHHVVQKSISKNSWNFAGTQVNLSTAGELPVLVDDNNTFWLITDEGLDHFVPATSALRTIRNGDKFTNFSRSQVICLMKDEVGSLWFGTVGGGINKYKSSPFNLHRYKSDAANSLANPAVLSFYEREDGKIWIGNNGGFFSLFDPQDQTFRRFKIPGTNTVIFDLLETSKQHLWMASPENGLVQYRIPDRTYQFYKHRTDDDQSINSNQTQRLLENEDGTMWVGTDMGLSLFDPSKGSFKSVELLPGETPSVFELVKDGHILWLGTLGHGVIGLDVRDMSLSAHFSSVTLKDDRVNDLITSIHIDEQRNLWAGTYGGGLLEVNLNDGAYHVHDAASGLPNQVIYYLTGDQKGLLWMTSNAGLIEFDKASRKVINVFDKDDGLQSNEFNRGAGMKSRMGEIFLGGIEGFNHFLPEAVIKKEVSPNTVFTSFEVFGTPDPEVFARIASGERSIQLTYDRNFIKLGFATLDFRNPSKNRYEYRLLGLSDNWISLSNQEPAAVFTSLDPGVYQFELKVSNSDGIWKADPYLLTIEILPPFWQQLWFEILMGLLLVAGIVLIPLRRYNRIKSQSEKLNQLVEERTRQIQTKNDELSEALESLQQAQAQLVESEKMASLGILSAGIGHEINNPLNFIRGGATALKNKVDHGEKMSKKDMSTVVNAIMEGVDRASKIVTSLGHFSRQQNDMDEDCCLDDIIDNVLVLLQSSIKGRIEVVKSYQVERMMIKGNEGRLHQAFLNVLSNAVQAIPGKGTIEIATRSYRNKYRITIRDDGEGISEENLAKIMDPFFTTKAPGKGTGLGLAITYTIIAENKGRIFINSEKGNGTTVTITL